MQAVERTSALFISDLHLSPSERGLLALFDRFLEGPARSASTLYMLGDIFERWIGDDGDLKRFKPQIEGLRKLSDAGVALYFMHGNYDFLASQHFLSATGAKMLPDPAVVDLYGTPTVLSHGDALCTDDLQHQQARKKWLDPRQQARVLALPVWIRRAIGLWLKAKSVMLRRSKPAEITDVSQQAVEQLLRSRNARQLIHGHTHRPAVHEFELDGGPARRIVLPNWTNGTAGWLICDSSGCRIQRLE